GGEALAQLGQRVDEGEVPPGFSPDRISLEVPGDMLADFPHRAAFLAEQIGHELGMPVDGVGDLAHPRFEPGRIAGERVREVAEQPRPPLTAAPDDDAVASGLLHQVQRILGAPDVAVTEYRYGVAELVFQR